MVRSGLRGLDRCDLTAEVGAHRPAQRPQAEHHDQRDDESQADEILAIETLAEMIVSRPQIRWVARRPSILTVAATAAAAIDGHTQIGGTRTIRLTVSWHCDCKILRASGRTVLDADHGDAR